MSLANASLLGSNAIQAHLNVQQIAKRTTKHNSSLNLFTENNFKEMNASKVCAILSLT